MQTLRLQAGELSAGTSITELWGGLRAPREPRKTQAVHEGGEVKCWRGKESSSTRADTEKAKCGQDREHTAPKNKPQAHGTASKL